MAYTYSRDGNIWFQIRVPTRLVPRYGTFIRTNLQTRDPSVARPLALRLASEWLAKFSGPDDEQETPAERGYGSLTAPIAMPQASVTWGTQAPSSPATPTRASMPVAAAQAHPQNKTQPKTSPPDKDGPPDLPALVRYWRQLNPELAPSSKREYESVAKQFQSYVARKSPADLVRADIVSYRDHLLSKQLARATVAKHIGVVATLLQVAYDADLIGQNVARAIKIPKAKVTVVSRRPFTAEEMKQLFLSSIYSLRKRYRGSGGEAAAWVPLIAFSTGARMEEICQLRVTDVANDPDHGPLLTITDQGEGQRLKTTSSRRTIPIHSELVRAGFLDYVEAVSEGGHAWLFPDLEPDHDGRRSGTYGQWFSRYLRSATGVGIKDPRLVFHSTRHTFKTLCRECGLSEEIHDALTGHAGTTVGRGYGVMPLAPLVDAVAKIRFPVPFPHVSC